VCSNFLSSTREYQCSEKGINLTVLTNRLKKTVMGEQVCERERAKDKPGF
jgi:hypothetical protein